jgi:hypothetical protein
MVFQTGTVSHGTFRPQDLLRAFSESYKQHCEGADFNKGLYEEAQRYADLLDRNNPVSSKDFDTVSDVIDALMERLDEVAAQHDCHFSGHAGDGSDFGFWPNEGGEEDGALEERERRLQILEDQQ